MNKSTTLLLSVAKNPSDSQYGLRYLKPLLGFEDFQHGCYENTQMLTFGLNLPAWTNNMKAAH